MLERWALGWFLALSLVSGQAAAQPRPPQNLVVTAPAGALSQSQLDLRWEAVPGALGYEVLRRRNGQWWLNEEDPNCTPMTTSTSLTGLSPDTEFEFCVRAVLAQGLSTSSLSVKARTSVADQAVTTPSRVQAPLQLPSTSATSPRVEDSSEPTISSQGSVLDLLPPPPKKVPVTPAQAASKPASEPKGPAPPVPGGLMGLFVGDGKIRLSWREVKEATGYLVEEERDGQWVTAPEGVIEEARPSLMVSGRGGPGPYLFRVRSRRQGSQSSPSLPLRVER